MNNQDILLLNQLVIMQVLEVAFPTLPPDLKSALNAQIMLSEATEAYRNRPQ